jgi:hypothetical protein
MPQTKGDDDIDAWCHRRWLIHDRRRGRLIDNGRRRWRNNDRRGCCLIDDRWRTLTLIGVMLTPFAALVLGSLAFTPFMLAPLLLVPFVVVPIVVIGARWQCAHAAQERHSAESGD